MSAGDAAEPPTAVYAAIVAADAPGTVSILLLDGAFAPLGAEMTGAPDDLVPRIESEHHPRWVWADAAALYGDLLARGIRVARCHDLRLVGTILRYARDVADDRRPPRPAWLKQVPESEPAPTPAALFEVAQFDLDERPGSRSTLAAVVRLAREQHDAIEASARSGALRLLAAAESAGALIAAEMRAAGLPWDTAGHEALLDDVLGTRGPGGEPAKLRAAADRVREALGDATLSIDSQPKVLRALHRVGVDAESTSRWELARYDHPAVGALVAYKKLAWLQSANGWAWLDEWVRDGRFRPVYVPGGVVTGRWASSGGGALQLPRMLRSVVRADPGWTFVVADVAQLEPRVLAGLARDEALAAAARGRDLYDGVVASGAVATRQDAKIALLGAIYGATTGESARLLPRLRRAYPRAMALVEQAASDGERGAVVATLLGRTSPPPSDEWSDLQRDAALVGASAGLEQTARRRARDRGRFTRNFVVQGTAAEWALAWLAELRTRLALIPPVDDALAAPRSGPAFAHIPHLALFLHDEIVVHTPVVHAERVAAAVSAAADAAGRGLFGDFPLDFRLDLRIADTADKA